LPTTLTTLNASYNFIADDDNNPSTIPSNLPSNTDITNNFPLDFSYQTSCGDRSVKFAAVTPQKTNYTYQWNFGDVTNNSSTLDRPEHLFSQFKAYDVKLTLTVIIHRTAVESIGETQTFVEYDAVKTIDVTKKVSVESGFTVSLKDVKLCTANTVLDAGEGYTSYLWQDGSTSQTFTATQPGIYSVTVTNASGCTASAQMAVVMCDDLKDLLQTIKIPNVFTPNGDGRNEFFEIKNLSQFLGNKLTIYDRWGGLVYEAVNYNSNWNATGVDPSVYFYQLTVYGMNQPAKTVTGWVEVLGERK
jgi:gliding motility-associated-like protein